MSSNVRWVSHRGFKEKFTENTKEAFQEALAAGFTNLETDIRCTSDGHLVLAHDETLERICNKSITIEKTSRKELEAIKLPCGSSLYFLEQLLDEFSSYTWTLDIKPNKYHDTTGKVIKLLLDRGLKDWAQKLYFISEKERDEKRLKKHFPEASYYAREPECYRAAIFSMLRLPFLGGIKTGRTYAITPELAGRSLFTKKIVNTYHSRKGRLIAFLPENAKEAQLAVEAGCDEILTDSKPL
jgi:glycerophosphoryl diester phosphodiesterase